MKLFGSLAGRALVMTTTRLINQGLMVLSPIILVHLLTVEQFGRYREFLLYAGVLSIVSGLGIYGSLLYFLPARPAQGRQFVVQAIVLTAISSLLVVTCAILIDAVAGGRFLGGNRWWLVAYVLLFVNLDFWEYRWLAERRTLAVFAYTSGRLLARMIVVVGAAALFADVTAIIVALVALEAIRLAVSALVLQPSLRSLGAEKGTGLHTWTEQLRFCLPAGTATVLSSGNRSVGGLFIATLLGPVALAHYTIGTYVQPLVTVLRNSISDVVLPHMVAEREARRAADELEVWRRSTVVCAVLLLPAGILLARFAEPLVLTVFSEEYRPAVALFQIYMLVLVRECFDFSVPMRVLGRTGPILQSNGIALALHAAALTLLIPAFGLPGAVWGFVASRFVEGAWLGVHMRRAWNIPWRELADWRDLGKVVLAALLAAPLGLAPFWDTWFGLVGDGAGAVLFLAVYCAVLYVLRLPEVVSIPQRMRVLSPPRWRREREVVP